MSTSILFEGKWFHLQKSGYFIAGRESRTAKPLRLHIAIWESVHGEVPEGFVIHHADHNKKNNSIINLLCWTRTFHQQYHARLMSLERREAIRKGNVGRRHTAETKAKMSEAQKGKIRSEKTKEKMRTAHLGQEWSTEARDKNSIAQTGSIKSLKTKERMRTSAKLAWLKRKGVTC